MRDCITPVILTFNEALNIERTLSHLTWAKQIVVVDSYSTDDTLEILKAYPQVRVFQRRFDTHANQWNYGLSQAQTEWILSLDADYVLTEALVQELSALSAAADSYSVRFQYCIFGQPLRGAILPPRTILFRKDKATYVDDGHTQLLQVNGSTAMLSSYIRHDDRKPLSRWLWAQDRYAILEAQKLRETPLDQLSWNDRIRRYQVIAPLLVLFYCLILRRGILDGRAGWYYAFQRMLAETLLSIHLLSYPSDMRNTLYGKKS
ncbi:MAG: glycosyltransferase family 2 protein [Oscillatoriophycideae cyanobacterium NC_groundwater_1537_Pr4_S-0.65um_50_18]|nr:glycosyltransferase family 2 protein [Oscillatoriophycideae cyanobacterium NC_groundwater_1537_Pr4_S-0.65um_50_18]